MKVNELYNYIEQYKKKHKQTFKNSWLNIQFVHDLKNIHTILYVFAGWTNHSVSGQFPYIHHQTSYKMGFKILRSMIYGIDVQIMDTDISLLMKPSSLNLSSKLTHTSFFVCVFKSNSNCFVQFETVSSIL